MLDAYIYNGLRTPFGRHAGKIASVRPDDLVGGVMNAVIAASPFKAEQIEDVILGCVNQAGEDSRNVARNSLLAAGLPQTVGGQTVNRLCASGLAAVIESARAVTCKEGELYLAGGVESMSRAPFVMLKSESPYARDFKMADTTIGARFPNPKLVKQYGNDSMPETGDNVAKDFGITRDAADEFALASQAKVARAQKDGFMAGEIAPVTIAPKSKKDEPTVVSVDEHPRETTIENLAKLKSLFEGGVVTAGNASGINDGAAAVVLMSAAEAKKRGLKPLARIVSWAQAGVDPSIMGTGPIPASKKALERAGWTIKDLDLIEANEAFAAQAISVNKGLGWDTDKVNVNGGAIAIGHPIGASGARVLTTLLYEMQRRDAKKALATLCIGGGMGIAICLARD